MKRFATICGVLFCCAAAALFIWSCTDEVIDPGEYDTAYFPLEIGSYIVYEVDSTFYDDFNDVVNRRTLQVREIVESIYTDASGRESYRIERQYRNGPGESWGTVGYNIWSAALDGGNAERVEENQRYIKLTFPVRVGKTWEGNTFINADPNGPLGYLEDWEYRISAIDKPAVFNGLNFDSTLTVIQQVAGTAIDTVGAREVYARNVGMVHRELWVLESQCTDCDPVDVACIDSCQRLPWEVRAESGFIVRESILEYGTL